ncbi:transposable element Tcb1 transposase [Trichonephila clavipes]|nr:transposable element Tcb1 transposase [Trichonephila clavipes]
MQNHIRLRSQWCEERRMWAAEWNEVVFTDESRICLLHHDGWIRVWIHRGERMLNICAMLHHTSPATGIMLPHQINFGNVWMLLGLLYPKNTTKVSLNQCRGVWQRGSPTMVATLANDSGRSHTLHRSLKI